MSSLIYFKTEVIINIEVNQMNGFMKRTEEKKQVILNTAFELFATKGVQKVSIQEIAKSAQVSQVTIYNYFGSKQQLLTESIKAYSYQKLESFKQLLADSSLTFEDKIRSLMVQKSEDIGSINLDFLQTLISDNPEIQKIVTEIDQNHSIPLFLELIEEGKQQGYIKKELSPQTVMFYMNMYNQAVRLQKDFFQTEESAKHFVDEILHLFFYGIMGKSKS